MIPTRRSSPASTPRWSSSETKADRLIYRAGQEVIYRGLNVYALTSAMTYCSSHDSEEFPVRRTGNDNVATALEMRADEVQRWISSAPFQQLLAA